jgi:hypothetical protein
VDDLLWDLERGLAAARAVVESRQEASV